MNDEFYTKFDDAQKRLDYWLKQAQQQPVTIMKGEDVLGVIVSHEEYLRFTRGDRKVVTTREMDPDDIAALEQEVPFGKPR